MFKKTNSRPPFKHNTKSQLRVANQVRVTSAVRVRFQIIFSVFFLRLYFDGFQWDQCFLNDVCWKYYKHWIFFACPTSLIFFAGSSIWRKLFRPILPKQTRSFEIIFEGKREKIKSGAISLQHFWVDKKITHWAREGIVFILLRFIFGILWTQQDGKYSRLWLPSPSVFPVYRINGTYTSGMCKLRP